MAPKWETITVDNEPMRVYMDAPAGPGPHPSVVVIMGLGGVEGSTQAVVQKLAAHGYAAAAPDLYHRQHDDIDQRIAKLPGGDPQIRTLRYEKMGKLLGRPGRERRKRDTWLASGGSVGVDASRNHRVLPWRARGVYDRRPQQGILGISALLSA